MYAVNLEPGRPLSYDGRKFVVRKRLPGGAIQLEDVTSANVRVLSRERYERAYRERRIKFLDNEEQAEFAKKRGKLAEIIDITKVGKRKEDWEKNLKDAQVREKYVKGIKSAGIRKFSKKNLDPEIAKISEKIGDHSPPSWRTVCRWMAAWEVRRDIRDLIPAHVNKGSRKRSLPKAVWDIIWKMTRKHYLVKGGCAVVWLYGMVLDAIDEENQKRPADDQLLFPGKMTIYRFVETLDKYGVTRDQKSKKRADKDFSQCGDPPRPTRALELVQFDDTRLDLLVVDAKTKALLGRPWITVGIDLLTKRIVGLHIGFNAPSTVSAAKCLKSVLFPKEELRKRYPDIQHEWDAWGLPEAALFDNALQNHSSDIESMCAAAGIQLYYAPPGEPWFKGSIERFFGRMHRELIHNLDGTTFSSVLHKDEYDSAAHAVVTFEKLLELIYTWLVDDYDQNEHRGTEDPRFACPGVPMIPALAWKQAVEEWEPDVFDDPEALDVVFGQEETRGLFHYGIDFNGLRYNCPELAAVRSRPDFNGQVIFKYDPDDIGQIYVLCDETRWDESGHKFDRSKVIVVPAKAFAYAKGLSLHRHKIIRAYALKHRHKADRVTLAKVKAHIDRLVREALGKRGMNRKHTHQAEAQWRATQSPPLHGKRNREVIEPSAGTTRDGISDFDGEAECLETIDDLAELGLENLGDASDEPQGSETDGTGPHPASDPKLRMGTKEGKATTSGKPSRKGGTKNVGKPASDQAEVPDSNDENKPPEEGEANGSPVAAGENPDSGPETEPGTAVNAGMKDDLDPEAAGFGSDRVY